MKYFKTPIFFAFILLAFLVHNNTLLKAEDTIPMASAIDYLQMASDSIPLGITYNPYNQMVYCALYWYGALAEINTNNLTEVNIYYLQSWHPEIQQNEICPYAITIDSNGCVWLSLRSQLGGQTGNLPPAMTVKFIPQNKSFIYIPLPVWESTNCIIFHDNSIWLAGKRNILQLDPSTNTFLGHWEIGQQLIGLVADATSIWVTEWLRDEVLCFDIPTKRLVESKTFSGISKPLGIAMSGDYLYVAQQPLGLLKKINKVSRQATDVFCAPVKNQGLYMIYVDSQKNVWFTDNSNHVGICEPSYKLYNSRPYCYFMTEVPTTPNPTMWFTAVGSAYIGMIALPKSPDIDRSGSVGLTDLVLMAQAYGSKPEDPNWNELADLDNNGIVGLSDLVILANRYGQTI